MLKKNDLIEYFYKGIKDKNNLKIGVEHEKFVLNKNNYNQVSYHMHNGIKDILLRFVKNGWLPKYDDEGITIVALERFGESITLEPGGQIELSGAQLNNIHQTCTETTRHLNELKEIGEEFDFIFSCPPYGNLEIYSDMQDDISNMEYPQFLKIYESIIAKSCKILKQGLMWKLVLVTILMVFWLLLLP